VPSDLARHGGVESEHADVDGRHAEEESGPEVKKGGGGSLMVETLEKAHAASGDEPAVDAVAEAVDMKERQAEQEPVGRVISQQVRRLTALDAKLLW